MYDNSIGSALSGGREARESLDLTDPLGLLNPCSLQHTSFQPSRWNCFSLLVGTDKCVLLHHVRLAKGASTIYPLACIKKNARFALHSFGIPCRAFPRPFSYWLKPTFSEMSPSCLHPFTSRAQDRAQLRLYVSAPSCMHRPTNLWKRRVVWLGPFP